MGTRRSGEDSAGRVVGYLVHDVNDAAVARRVALFVEARARVRIGGFRRQPAPGRIAAADMLIDLGPTRDTRLGQRARAVLASVVRPARARTIVGGADVVVARNLEMLAIAARVRARHQRLVYECLDLHRLLLSDRPAGMVLRALERRLFARVAMIVTSSPAYVDAYFRARQGYRGPILVVENKVALDAPQAMPQSRPAGVRPWRIGWFGIIRCRKSLAMLVAMSAASAGRIEVVIAGRPSLTAIPDFEAIVAAAPALSFAGPYRLDRLPALYATVDFAWAIDFYEEGFNSAWLLPNRLYESLAAGVPPLALADVEAGRWLERTKVGRTFADPEAEIPPFLSALKPAAYDAMRAAVVALPTERTRFVAGEAARIAAAIIDGPPDGD